MKRLCVLALAICGGGCATSKKVSVAVESTSLPTSGPVQSPTVPAPQDPAEVRAVEFSPDNQWLAVGTLRRSPTLSGTVTVRDVATNRVVKSWILKGGTKYLAFSPDGETLAVAGAESRLTVWKWRIGQLLHSEKQDTDFAGEERVDVAFSPDGDWLATAAGGELISTKTWKHRRFPNRSHPFGYQQIIDYVRFSPDSRVLLLGLANDDMVDNFRYGFVNVKTGQGHKIRHFSWEPPVFSRTGSLLAASVETSSCVWKWTERSLKPIQTFQTRRFVPQAFSPNNRFVAGLAVESETEGPIEIWSVSGGKRIKRFSQKARRLIWPTTNLLLVGDEKGVQRFFVDKLHSR